MKTGIIEMFLDDANEEAEALYEKAADAREFGDKARADQLDQEAEASERASSLSPFQNMGFDKVGFYNPDGDGKLQYGNSTESGSVYYQFTGPEAAWEVFFKWSGIDSTDVQWK